MARLNGTTMGIWEPFESLWWWCMMVLGLGAQLYLMAGTKNTGPVSPPPSGSTSRKRIEEVTVEMDGEEESESESESGTENEDAFDEEED
ncbi:unnamed protein product [Ilex paraguariensis]|uniref:Uncharacterized protein n=1 Tax=Ilex paraguariensis TaxID=185542 RepID=A0ABC8TIT7_9AQUA